LYIAQGSSFEFETQLILSFELGFIEEEVFQNTVIKLNEIQKMLNGLINSIENKINK
jgi:four helix bundle protein